MSATQVIDANRSEPAGAPPTAETVRQAQDGDPAAFERLYRAHYRHIFALCLRMTADERQAEEATQEAFVRAWRHLSSFRQDSRFGTWVHRIAVNVVLKGRRDRGRRSAREESHGDLSRFTAAVRRAMPETRVALERGIAGLPPGAREVLVLHDIEGYKYREIAELIGVAEGTVKSQLHRARTLLQEVLES